ncbi:hypothetical protein EZV61_02200 [Corallincola luteus]|uniref:PBP domain-containing protein n=2 Tax=Corallincola TaxID=1775176 RepID=A0A368NM66_9GAMM|nr:MULTISPECIES: substrate-binding domain-containing protein [Corallincola]RCU51647.1 hypothetical protein DU002_04025 [Corallincola holothuriorum]TCI04805.1 hypothetical protein EZV61_02200 [Corallincola luteus]
MKGLMLPFILLLSLCVPTTAWAADIAVVAHPSVQTDALTVKELKSIFSMRLTAWSEGQMIAVYVLPKQNRLHETFCRSYLELFSYQLERSWNRLVYSGFGQAPKQMATSEELRDAVATTPGAIGYIKKEDVDDSVKIILID